MTTDALNGLALSLARESIVYADNILNVRLAPEEPPWLMARLFADQRQLSAGDRNASNDNDLKTLETGNHIRPAALSAGLAAQTPTASGPCSTPTQKPPCWDDAQSGITALSRMTGVLRSAVRQGDFDGREQRGQGRGQEVEAEVESSC